MIKYWNWQQRNRRYSNYWKQCNNANVICNRKQEREKHYDLWLEIFDCWLKWMKNVKNTDIFLKTR